jgi:hypothetical protein
MATYEIDSEFIVVSTERGYDVYRFGMWIADCTTRDEVSSVIGRDFTNEAIRIACERPVPYGC